MYPNYSIEESRAIISVIIDMISCDNDIHKNEMNYVNNIGIKMGLTRTDVKIAQILSPSQVERVFSSMSKVKRTMATKLILFASLADGKVSNAERRMEYYLQNSGILEPLSDSECDPMSLSNAVTDFMNS